MPLKSVAFANETFSNRTKHRQPLPLAAFVITLPVFVSRRRDLSGEGPEVPVTDLL